MPIGATTAWRQSSGLRGQGVRVGVIDSGMDDTHPVFASSTSFQYRGYACGVADSGVTLVDDHGTHGAGTIVGRVTSAERIHMASPRQRCTPG